MTENIFFVLSWTGAILSIVLACISFVLPKERVAVHAIIVSIFLLLIKIGIIAAILIMEVHFIFKIIVIVNSITFMAFWGFVLWKSIICLRESKKK